MNTQPQQNLQKEAQLFKNRLQNKCGCQQGNYSSSSGLTNHIIQMHDRQVPLNTIRNGILDKSKFIRQFTFKSKKQFQQDIERQKAYQLKQIGLKQQQIQFLNNQSNQTQKGQQIKQKSKCGFCNDNMLEHIQICSLHQDLLERMVMLKNFPNLQMIDFEMGEIAKTQQMHLEQQASQSQAKYVPFVAGRIVDLKEEENEKEEQINQLQTINKNVTNDSNVSVSLKKSLKKEEKGKQSQMDNQNAKNGTDEESLCSSGSYNKNRSYSSGSTDSEKINSQKSKRKTIKSRKLDQLQRQEKILIQKEKDQESDTKSLTSSISSSFSKHSLSSSSSSKSTQLANSQKVINSSQDNSITSDTGQSQQDTNKLACNTIQEYSPKNTNINMKTCKTIANKQVKKLKKKITKQPLARKSAKMTIQSKSGLYEQKNKKIKHSECGKENDYQSINKTNQIENEQSNKSSENEKQTIGSSEFND